MLTAGLFLSRRVLVKALELVGERRHSWRRLLVGGAAQAARWADQAALALGLYRYAPRGLIERPKMGFSLPIDQWVCGQFREWADALLYGLSLQRQRLLDPAQICRKRIEHQSGERDWQRPLWVVLMLQAWLARWFGEAP
jgi:hypothetical protein